MERLKKVCKQVLDVEEGLMIGKIPFSWDNLMSAMKPGHPADIIDEILYEIWDVRRNKEPSIEQVKNTMQNLTEFRDCLEVPQLDEPIQLLTEYLQDKGAI